MSFHTTPGTHPIREQAAIAERRVGADVRRGGRYETSIGCHAPPARCAEPGLPRFEN